MRLMTINGESMTTKEAMYTHFARVFSFPAHFGHNLDALWDLLNECDEPTIIEFTNVDLALENLGEYGEKLIDLLKKLEAENHCYTLHLHS